MEENPKPPFDCSGFINTFGLKLESVNPLGDSERGNPLLPHLSSKDVSQMALTSKDISLLITIETIAGLRGHKSFMQLIRCTKKLQKEMGLKKPDLTEAELPLGLLGPWHANLIFIARRKCVLFVNDKTLFNFIVPDVPRKLIRNLDDLFRNYLITILADEGFYPDLIEKILAEYDEIAYANTSSRSILGTMNDLTLNYKFSILNEGGVHSATIPGIIQNLNRMPIIRLNGRYAIEVLKALCDIPTRILKSG